MINLTKENFVALLTAYSEDSSLQRDFEDFIEKYSDSYVVLRETPLAKAVLSYVGKEMEDDDDLIGWYLFEKEKDMHITVNDEVIYLEDLEDLYNVLAIVNKSDEDIAAYIADEIWEKHLDKFGDIKFMDRMDLYMYICHNIDKVIDIFKNPTNRKESNVLVYLDLLRAELSKGGELAESENIGRKEISAYIEKRLKEVGCDRVDTVTEEMINVVIGKMIQGASLKDAVSLLINC